MANTYFKFKKFTIHQDKTAMKVGTDGVLLGAWVNTNNVKRILDVGTGTGLIAIMCAQRTKDVQVDAVEIEVDAFDQARGNIAISPWRSRMQVFLSDFCDFLSEENMTYDLIVSNPPFFINSLKNDCDKKTKARHTDSLSYENLIKNVLRLLTKNGRFAVVLPYEAKDDFLYFANNSGLYLNRILFVKPTPVKDAKRVLMELSYKDIRMEENTLVVEEFGRHGYSEDYINLTRDFYLNF